MKHNIFRAYDIRGVYGKDLDAEAAWKIAAALAIHIKEKYQVENPKIVVGKDNRIHGAVLQETFLDGLSSQGVEITIIEDCTSPMLYFAVCEEKFDAGVNITASHNPSEYNGFKLVGRHAHSICGDEIQAIAKIAEKIDLNEEKFNKDISTLDIYPQYLQKISSLAKLPKKLKIVVDAGNGIAGKYYPDIFRSLGCEVVELYCTQDGNFPNHEADPVVESNTTELQKIVVDCSADLGISFDGDGDRLAIIDEQGNYHDANQTLVLLLRDILSRHPQTNVVYTVSNSLVVAEEIKKYNGFPLMVPVGHSFVEQAMQESGALLGGEQSGHFFIAENYYGYDDAAYTAAKLLEIFSKTDKSVSEIYHDVPFVYTDQEKRPYCADDQKFAVIRKIADRFSKDHECNTMDGVRVEFKDGSWLGIRASNTSPCLSVCAEAKTNKSLNRLKKLAQETLDEFGIDM